MTILTNKKKIYDKLLEKKLIIFDYDGIIVNSVNIKTIVFKQMYRRYGYDIVKKVEKYHIQNGGVNRIDKFKYFHKKFLKKNISNIEVKKLSLQFSNLVYKKIINCPNIFGVKALLNYFKNSKIIAVNSATPIKELKKIIEKRNEKKFFNSICGFPYKKQKNLKILLKRHKIKKKDAIFFGDSLQDYLSAKKVSMDFVWVGKSIKTNIKHIDTNILYIKNFSKIIIN